MGREPGYSIDAKNSFFEITRSVGLFRVGRYFQRNNQKILILCYHGVSKADEHLWHPALYIPRSLFRQRLQILRDFGYQVLPLSTALEQLNSGTLHGRTAAITFDDGWHDFYTEAWPELRSFQYPATVYQTTYYSSYSRPVFDPACRYLLWKGRGKTLRDSKITGTENPFTLDSPSALDSAFCAIQARLRKLGSSADDKDCILAKLAEHLDVDFGQVLNSRLLHLMNASEMAEVSNAGIDIQLHTHRHRLPLEKKLFLEEIETNREIIEAATGKRAVHFCYPNGNHRPEFLTWLKSAGVLSATTCETGCVSHQSERLLLPRVTDSATVSQARFESWLSGVGLLVSAWKRKTLSLSGRDRDDANEVSLEVTANGNQPTGETCSKAMARAAGGN